MKPMITFFGITTLCALATLTCNGMMPLEKDKLPFKNFTLTVNNQTQNNATVQAFYKEKPTLNLGTVGIGSKRSFTIDTEKLDKVSIVAGTTTETVTQFSNKTITIKKTTAPSKAAGPSKASGFGSPSLIGKQK